MQSINNLHLIFSKNIVKKALVIFLAVSLTACGDNKTDAEKFGALLAEQHRKKNPFFEFKSVDSMVAWANKNVVYPASVAAKRPIRVTGVVDGWLPVMPPLSR